MTFTVNPDETIGCVFVNSLVPEESLGGGTGTPTVTLPPTDTSLDRRPGQVSRGTSC